MTVGAVRFGAASNQLYRVFNRGSFSYGGRFYGGWWQNIPSESRAGITIDGIQTVEMDYPRLHPTLLYAEIEKVLDGDPYDLPSWPRDLVKVAFNTLVNADTRQAAVRSIANEIGGKGAFASAKALVSEIEVKHAPVAHMFGSGAGLRLMRRDSDMTEGLLRRLIKRGVVVLPIHDSYIAANRHTDKGELMEAMEAALHNAIGDKLHKSIGYAKSIPQYGTSPLSPRGVPAGGKVVGCILVFFPDLAQRDLFGADALAVPSSDVLGWHAGIAPPGVRKALRHEMGRRGLRHADVAAQVGISRPQFENILQGRFGASVNVASSIRGFLIDGAKTVGVGAP